MLFEGVAIIFAFLTLTELIGIRIDVDYKDVSKKWDRVMMELGYNYSLYKAKATSEGFECIISIPPAYTYQHLISIERTLEKELGCFISSSPLGYRQSTNPLEYECYQAKLRLIYTPNSIPLKNKIYR